MSKFDRRVDNLIRRTHNYISHEDYCLIRDYFHAIFKREEKPEDLDERVAEFKKLDRRHDADHNPQIKARMDELSACNAVRVKALLPWAIENCERYPNGVWLPKWYTSGMPDLVKSAKSYLKRIKEEAERKALAENKE